MESLRDLSLNHTPLMTHNYPGLVVLAYDPLTTGPSRQTEEGRAKAPPLPLAHEVRSSQWRWNSTSTTICTATGCPSYVAGLNRY